MKALDTSKGPGPKSNQLAPGWGQRETGETQRPRPELVLGSNAASERETHGQRAEQKLLEHL